MNRDICRCDPRPARLPHHRAAGGDQAVDGHPIANDRQILAALKQLDVSPLQVLIEVTMSNCSSFHGMSNIEPRRRSELGLRSWPTSSSADGAPLRPSAGGVPLAGEQAVRRLLSPGPRQGQRELPLLQILRSDLNS